MTRCVGHRGAAGLAPENTLAAFEAGIAAGAAAVECDVHLTRDGRLVLMHDSDVSRTTDGVGQIGALTFETVRSLNAAGRQRGGRQTRQQVPTLDEFLALVAGRCVAQIEIKVPDGVPYAGIEAQVVDALRRHDALTRAEVISFDPATLDRVQALAPELRLGYLGSQRSLPSECRAFPELLAQRARAHAAAFLSLDRAFFSPAHLAAARGAGLEIAVWTVDEPAEMRRLIDLGVDSITTDRPDLLRAELDLIRTR